MQFLVLVMENRGNLGNSEAQRNLNPQSATKNIIEPAREATGGASQLLPFVTLLSMGTCLSYMLKKKQEKKEIKKALEEEVEEERVDEIREEIEIIRAKSINNLNEMILNKNILLELSKLILSSKEYENKKIEEEKKEKMIKKLKGILKPLKKTTVGEMEEISKDSNSQETEEMSADEIKRLNKKLEIERGIYCMIGKEIQLVTYRIENLLSKTDKFTERDIPMLESQRDRIIEYLEENKKFDIYSLKDSFNALIKKIKQVEPTG